MIAEQGEWIVQQRGSRMKDYTGRRRLIYLDIYLKKYTDKNHPASTNELISVLKRTYHIETDRNTITRDLDVLMDLCGISVIRSTQNRYYFNNRIFSEAELRLLLDAVSSSRFITEKDSQKLATKLQNLASPSMEENLRRNIYVTGRIKSRNALNYRIVDALNAAINKRVQVQFQYTAWDLNKHRVIRQDGKPYTVSPYALIWDGDFYYVIGYCTSHNTVQNFRVDRIAKPPKLLKKPAVPAPENFSVVDYQKESFRMYSTEEAEEVTLLCDNDVMNGVIDQFGQDVDTKKDDEHHFTVKVTVYPSPTFYRWIFGFAGSIRILYPSHVKEEYSVMLSQAETAQGEQ